MQLLKKIFEHPDAIGLDLDSPQATQVHARLIREKPFLNRLYNDYYLEFSRADALSPPGPRIEIGSGGGFLSEIIPEVITCDIRSGANVDIEASALALPFSTSSVGAVFLLNVLHHLSNPAAFFLEMTRVLKPGGRVVLVEPYLSPLSNLIYSHLHHEPFDPHADWSLPAQGPMSSANDALPWIIFVRDRPRFEAEFPKLHIDAIRPHTALLYLLSGGVSMRSLAPGFAYGPLAKLEGSLGRMSKFVASMMTINLRRE
jgi:SAM-dependent methyltransferase